MLERLPAFHIWFELECSKWNLAVVIQIAHINGHRFGQRPQFTCDDSIETFAGDTAYGDLRWTGDATRFSDLDGPLRSVRYRIRRPFVPPSDRFLPCESGMFKTDPFALPLVEADLIIDSHRLRCAVSGVPFYMDVIENVLDCIFNVLGFAGEDPIA